MAITEIASLAQVKSYLRIPDTNTGDDTIIQTIFMPAAQKVVEREIGHIVAKKIRAERHDGGNCEIWLRELPVLFIENVQEGWGYYNWELDDQEVNSIPALSIFAYSLDNPEEGLVTRRAPGSVLFPFVWGRDNIRVDYVVGRTEIPDNAVLVFCEIVAHWYRASQLRTSVQPVGFNASVLDMDFTRSTGDTSINLGVPAELIELLKPNRRRPIIG
jgi:hypothetical protein